MFGKTHPFKWLSLGTVPLQYLFPLLPDRLNTRASNRPSILRSSYQGLVREKLACYFVFVGMAYRMEGGGALPPEPYSTLLATILSMADPPAVAY